MNGPLHFVSVFVDFHCWYFVGTLFGNYLTYFKKIAKLYNSNNSSIELQVRNSVAYTISTIASWDWPDHWPELFDILMGLLKENNEFAVQGSVRVLKEFVRDLGTVFMLGQ
mgnify:CR=1 FL=1